MEKIFVDILTEKDASYIPEFFKKIMAIVNQMMMMKIIMIIIYLIYNYVIMY